MSKKAVVIHTLPATISNPLADVTVYGPGAKLKGTGVYARVREAFRRAFPDLKGAALKKSVDAHVEANRSSLNALFVGKVQLALANGVGGRTKRTASGKYVFEVEPLKAVSKLEMTDEQLIAMAKARGLEIFPKPATVVIESLGHAEEPADKS